MFTECIKIDSRVNMCSICNKPFVHSIRFIHGYKDGDETIKEATFVTAHAGCRNLSNRLKKAKQEVLDLEYQMFSKTSI